MNRAAPPNDITTAPSPPAELIEALGGLSRPIVISHVVPDADAIGSMFAMALAWASDGCQPMVSLPEGSLSQRLAFFVERARPSIATPDDFAKADGFIVLDTAKKGRCNVGKALKETDWLGKRRLFNIDHHNTNTRFGDINWVVGDASSTCELAYYLLRAGGRRISPVCASLLYAGMQTDTIGFSLPSTSPHTLRAAADLVELGADVGDLGERLGRSQRKSEFDLFKVIYANTRLAADGGVAYSSASHEEIRAAGCRAADIDDQINVPRSLDGVRLAMLFTEGNRGKTRINFRSSGSVTVVELANEFNGGGHAQAAGAVLDCGLQEAIGRVVPRAIEYLKTFG